MRVSFNDLCPTGLNLPIIPKVCCKVLCCRQAAPPPAHFNQTKRRADKLPSSEPKRPKPEPAPTLNSLIDLQVAALLVVSRQVSGNRRLSDLLSYRLEEITLSLLVPCQTPSLLKLHLERAGASICRSEYFLTGGRNPSAPVLLSWNRPRGLNF